MHSVIGDICDTNALSSTFRRTEPEIVFHLATQPLVRASYCDPATTYFTNICGTISILECLRLCSFINVTTDKVYRNREWHWGYRETDELCGLDPYSNSKSCSELVTFSYKYSFFEEGEPAISTVRAGNVIGGGDFAEDRIIPDCVRAAQAGRIISIRNPNFTRPYQHVLESLFAYLLIAQKQYDDFSLADSYNIGPDERDCVSSGKLASLFCSAWGNGAHWVADAGGGGHEAHFLKLDCSKATARLQWRPKWRIADAVAKTVEWFHGNATGRDVNEIMRSQISEYLGEGGMDVRG